MEGGRGERNIELPPDRKYGKFGRYQWFQYVLQVWPAFTAGMHMLSQVEIGATPRHRCLFNDTSLHYINTSRKGGNIWNGSDSGQDTIFSFENCFVSSINQSSINKTLLVTNEIEPEVVPCNRWEFDTTDYGTTIITEWNLVCDRRWLAAIAQTVYMLGCIVGSTVFGELADRYGRRTLLVPTGFLQLVLAVASGFSNHYEVYVATRFLTAINTSAGFLIGFVMTMEMVSPNLRATMGFTFQIGFALGLATVAAWGYLIRDWHVLQVVYGLHGLPMLLYYWCLDESPRWLFSRNRTKEAEAILTKMLICNGVRKSSDKSDLTIEQIQDALMDLPHKQCEPNESSNLEHHEANLAEENSPKEPISIKENQEIKEDSYGVVDLFRKPRMRLRMMNISLAWFAAGLVYYGLSMSSHVLAGNPHFMLFLSGILEIPPLLVLFKTMDWIGRRPVMSASLGLGGLSCIATQFFPQSSNQAWAIAAICVVMTGKSLIGVALAVSFNYTAELFPTAVRSSAMGIASAALRLAASITPLILLLDYLTPKLPTILFGSLSVISCFLTLYLPETKGCQLIHSIEDGEQFGKGDHFFSSCCATRNEESSQSKANSVTLNCHEPTNKKSHENLNTCALLGYDNPTLTIKDEPS